MKYKSYNIYYNIKNIYLKKNLYILNLKKIIFFNIKYIPHDLKLNIKIFNEFKIINKYYLIPISYITSNR